MHSAVFLFAVVILTTATPSPSQRPSPGECGVGDRKVIDFTVVVVPPKEIDCPVRISGVPMRLLFRPSMFNNVYVVALLFLIPWCYSEATIAAQTINTFQTPVYYIVAVLPLVIIGRSMTRKVREARFVYETEDPDNDEDTPLTSLEPRSLPS